nr:MAG TPA: hypothetical protein [Caudoviricetes sp.]
MENIKRIIDMKNNIMNKEFKTFSFKSKTIIPFYYNKSLRKISVNVGLQNIGYVLNRLEEEVNIIHNTWFMKKITKSRLRKEMIYKNFRSILDEFKGIVKGYQIPNKISIPLIEDPLGVKLFMQLFASALLDEILKLDIKDSRKIINTFNSIMEMGRDVDYISDYELRFLMLTVDLIEIFFREYIKKMEENKCL